MSRCVPRPIPLIGLALLFGMTTLPARAASSASSEVSDSVSTSVGSVSGSVRKSSDSSSKGKEVAEGDYKVIEVAAADERPGLRRVKLQAVGGDSGAASGEFELYLPQEAVDRGQLAPGVQVSAKQRPYGLEFGSGQARKAFFLVMHDDWYRELNSRPVTL